MTRKKVIELINRLVEKKLTFESYTIKLEKELANLSAKDLKESLLKCGVIPESFSHDSTQEKLYSKYTDILLSQAFNLLGIKSVVVKQRADSADVEGQTKGYSIVADAKTFRLSRTAKNQKDFKVEALSRWRKDKDFACLVSPLYQYPKSTSQIYRQAIDKNVALLSYIHLVYLLSQKKPDTRNYKELWLVSKKMKGAKNAISYWATVDTLMAKIVQKSVKDLERFKQLEIKFLTEVAKEEVEYLEERILAIKKLTHEEAMSELIKSSKLNSKIIQIKKMSGLK